MDKIHPFTAQTEIEEQAADWLVRLDGDQPPTEQEMAELKQWINRSPVHREQLRRLTQFWHRANILTELSFPLADSQRPQGLWDRLKQQYTQSWSAPVLAGAAMLLSLAVGLLLLYPSSSGVSGNGIYETRIGEQNTITLVDGSVIQLNTNSQLQVDYIDNQRNVMLIAGEAHFEVAKDKRRPFSVQAGEGSVRAVGTAFSVRLNQQALKVIVTEGKVALEESSQSIEKTPRGFLHQGQAVEFSPLSEANIDDQIQELNKQDIEKQLAWRNGLLLFDGETLRQVIDEVNRYTKLNIEIIDSEVADISIGGQFRVGEIDAMLTVLEHSFNVDVRRPDVDTVQLAIQQL